MDNTREKEIRLESQLVVVTAYTVLTIALMSVTALLSWELWMLPLMLVALVSVWVLHITQGLTDKMRSYYYTVLILIEFFFYGVHSTSLFDLPILLLLILFIFVLLGETGAIYLAVGTYVLELVYHISILHASDGASQLDYAKIALDIVAAVLGFLLTRYLLKRSRTERENYADVIAQLRQTTHRAEDFLTNVSHEFRTPINAVTGMSDVMLRNEDNPQKRKDLVAIQQAGHRLFAQISDILDYTELDTGRLKVSAEPYMIASTINDLITEMRFMENQSDLELVVDVDPLVPSMLVGDEGKIKKIIRHLVDNAFKFTKVGGIYIHVCTLKKDYGVNLCITVQDTGIGIEDAQLDKLYEKFYQADASRSRRAGGMGLGLSIVYGMVQELGGFMHITGTEGKGTLVHISIPQEVTDATPCMLVEKNERTCIAAYTQPKKYATPAVREFYDLAIEHLRSGLGVGLHKASTLGELQKIQNAYSLTHVYIGREEYEENPAYFEELGKTLCVIVIAKPGFTPLSDTRIIVTSKPFNGFPLTNILQNGTKVYMRDVFFAEKRMICPKVRALVVDDDEMNLLVASGIMRDYQMDVTTALSGMEAIALCEESSFDIIFLDHMMPEMDGVETMHRLRNMVRYSDESVVIVALTANAVSGAREMFLQEGFDEFVAKPIETTAFERVLRKVLPASAIQFVAKEAAKKDRYAHEPSAEEAPLAHPAAASTATAESAPTASAPQDTFDALNALGLNTKSALSYCRDDHAFYLDLLKKFSGDAVQKGAEIKTLYDSADWETYKIKVHALKSTAKTVGMNALSKRAEALEQAAKKSDVATITQDTTALLSEYAALTEQVRAVLGVAAAETTARADGDATAQSTAADENNASPASGAAHTDTDDGAWAQKLTELSAALDAFESDKAEAVAKELAAMTHGGKAGKDLLAGVLEYIQNFDFQPAAEIVSALRRAADGAQGDAQ